MFRIYRDVRFSKDKRPYKEHGACQFRHRLGKDAHSARLLCPPGARPAVLRWWRVMDCPRVRQLKQIRSAIADDPTGWGKVVKNKRFNDTFWWRAWRRD